MKKFGIVTSLLVLSAVSAFAEPLSKENSLRYGIHQVNVISNTVGADLVKSHNYIGFGSESANDLQNELGRKYGPCGVDSQLEEGYLIFDINIEFSTIPIFGSDFVKDNLVNVTADTLTTSQREDIAGAIFREYLPSYSMYSDRIQHSIKQALGAPTDAEGDTALEKVMVVKPTALNAVDVACTLGADISFLQTRANDEGYNKFSLYVFHNRTAFSTLSRFLGVTMHQTEQEFQDDKDLFKIDSAMARALFVREKYDV
jgi:hypothetical protein